MADNAELNRAIALAAEGRGEEARAIVEQLAADGDREALFTLGDMHWRGLLVPRDYARGRALFEQAAEAGNVLGGYCATNLLASGNAGRRDWPAALARLRAESETDPARAEVLALVEAMDLDANGDPAQLPERVRLLESPDVSIYPKLFTPAECTHVHRVGAPNLAPSLVADPEHGQVRDPIRTSDGSTIHGMIEDPAIHVLNRRLAAATQSSYACGEMLQLLRYAPGQQYRRHLDALPGLDNQRVRTIIVYLNDGYEGGETGFPQAEVKLKGSQGDALFFVNVRADGRPDPMSEHEGMPVTAGTKFIASRWIRARPIDEQDEAGMAFGVSAAMA